MKQIVDNMYESLNENGVFIGSFFGTNDDWNCPNEAGRRNVICLSEQEIRTLLNKFEIKQLNENERDQQNGSYIKHYHTYEFIAVKK